ncbi:SCO family protein [Alicyclobacillus sp. SO9]|uniref:SCO family protein n=1 Tax=Alicyclobacillus sp. SO9 TaxID=2665646 RepID=UPI0018E84BFB|nr:SCO family protein [Alicyclobacillus sp. SO9]QQE77714.1 redoxin domain-containing protein [Alicyclobacillus sp. SO9]
MKKQLWRSEWVIPIVVLLVVIGILSVVEANAGINFKHTTDPGHATSNQGVPSSGVAGNSTQSHRTKNDVITTGDPLHGKPAPNFTLTDQFGKKISLKQFRGKTVVLAFVDSRCTTICPLTTEDMLKAVQLLGPKAAQHVQLLGINANPVATSVAAVKQYSVEHNMLHSWHFLTAPKTELQTVWKNYHIYSGIVNGQIDHTPALYIIGPNGKEKLLYMTPSQYASVNAESHVMAKHIAQYLPTSIRPHISLVPYQGPKKGPQNQIKLQPLSATGLTHPVILDPSKPQLIVFFASFVPNIRQKLLELNQFASQPGHPQVIAIDVGTIEPGMGDVNKLISGLPKLHFPVAVDKTGQVADAFHAQDLTWFSLTNGSGHIVWHHDAWLKMTSLGQDIRKALNKSS